MDPFSGTLGILFPLAGSAVTFRQAGWKMVGEGAEEPQHTCIRIYLATPDTITGVSKQPPSCSSAVIERSLASCCGPRRAR